MLEQSDVSPMGAGLRDSTGRPEPIRCRQRRSAGGTVSPPRTSSDDASGTRPQRLVGTYIPTRWLSATPTPQAQPSASRSDKAATIQRAGRAGGGNAPSTLHASWPATDLSRTCYTPRHSRSGVHRHSSRIHLRPPATPRRPSLRGGPWPGHFIVSGAPSETPAIPRGRGRRGKDGACRSGGGRARHRSDSPQML